MAHPNPPRPRRAALAPAPRPAWLATRLLALAALTAACGGPEPGADAPADTEATTVEIGPGFSVDAKLETFAMLVEDQDAPRHPSDGGGTARFAGGEVRPVYTAGSRQRFEIVYEAGPLGVALGGAVLFQPSPFWDWDRPQIRSPEAPGYTEVSTSAEGVELALDDSSGEVLVIGIEGRALRPGEQIRIVFGAGELGARIDPYAEARTQLFVSVDGDGDGVRKMVSELPTLDVVAAAPAGMIASLPSTAAPGDTVFLTLAVLDARGNAGPKVGGELGVVDPPDGLEVPDRIELDATSGGDVRVPIVVREPGIYRLSVAGRDELEPLFARTNPLAVTTDPQPILWADLHGHSHFSDGTGTPDQYFTYARDVAALDVAVLTDHDHWGMRFLDDHADMWDEIRGAVSRHHDPGKFVTLLGYEWTSWLHGHRHVLYFGDEGHVYSSLDPETDDPAELWDALRGQPALTFAHHSAGGPISTNWRFAPDPELEPLTEIVSIHGSSEAMDAPARIYDPVEGNFVRDALSAGYRFGFVGSGDGHDGHPGLTRLASPGATGGLAAILTGDRTREGILAAMRARRVYATNGARIILRVDIDGAPMGSLLFGPDPDELGASTQLLTIEVVGTAPIDHVDLIRSGQTATLDGEDQLELAISREIPRLMPGEYHYVRVVQVDGSAAWSSPFYVDPPPEIPSP